MKSLITVGLIGLAFLVGCSNFENYSTEPELNGSSITGGINKISSDSSDVGTITVSNQIDGSIGGQLTILQDVHDSIGRLVNVNTNLIVPAGAYQDIKPISMKVDCNSATIDFNPSMVFDSSLTFNFIITNLNLAKMGYQPGDTVLFVYFDPSGKTFPVLSKDVNMNYYWGRLRVHNAKIEHFSRYGFVRKTEVQVRDCYKKSIMTDK